MVDPASLTAEDLAFQREYEKFCADPSEERDYRPLGAALGAACKANPRMHLAGPGMAVMWFIIMEHEFGWHWRIACRAVRSFLHGILWRNRPLWNDFYMYLWQLSRQEWAVTDLYWHLHRANRKRIAPQAFTGDWMVSSVCQQDSAFASIWYRTVSKNGHWHATPPGEFAASLGDDPAILERIYQLHPEVLHPEVGDPNAR